MRDGLYLPDTGTPLSQPFSTHLGPISNLPLPLSSQNLDSLNRGTGTTLIPQDNSNLVPSGMLCSPDKWIPNMYGLDTTSICNSQEKSLDSFSLNSQAQPTIYVDKSERSLIVEWYEGDVRREQRISYKKYGNGKAKQRAEDLIAKIKAGYTFDQLYPEKGPTVVAIYENVGRFQVSLIRDRKEREWRVEWVNNCGGRLRARWSCKKIGNDEARNRAEALAESLKKGEFKPRLLHKATGTRLSRCELRADLSYDVNYSSIFGLALTDDNNKSRRDRRAKSETTTRRRRKKTYPENSFAVPPATARTDTSVPAYPIYGFQSYPTFQTYQELSHMDSELLDENGENTIYNPYLHEYSQISDYYDPYGVYSNGNYYYHLSQQYANPYQTDPYPVTRLCSTEQETSFIPEKGGQDERLLDGGDRLTNIPAHFEP